jgi:hypothetical protein
MEDPGITAAEEARLWRFMLERAVHDLNNQLGGILSITEAHLARAIEEPELRDSLELINGGARAGRDLLLAVTEALVADSGGAELTSLGDLLAYLHDNLKLFLPRRTELIARPAGAEGLVKVNAKALFARLLILIESELSNPNQRTWKGELALKSRSKTGWLIFRSQNRSSAAPSALCNRLFSSMRPPLAGYRFKEEPTEFEVALGCELLSG